MGWLKNLITGSDKAMEIADKTVSAGISGINALFFTAEEKSQASQRVMDTYLELVKLTGSESTTRSITRRIIAVMSMGLYCVLIVVCAVSRIWSVEYSAFIFDICKSLNWLVVPIAVFYFGYYGLKQISK